MPTSLQDIKINDKIGCFTVLNIYKKYADFKFQVKCDCGKISTIYGSRVNRSLPVYCNKNCSLKKSDKVDPKKYYCFIGDKYDNWTVLSEPYYSKSSPWSKEKRNQYVKCKCICGKEKEVPCRKLRSGKTKSCGCVIFEARRKGSIANNGFKKCSKCLKILKVDAFNLGKNRKDGLLPNCRQCGRDNKFRWEYGISLEYFFKIAKKQKGLCEICGNKCRYLIDSHAIGKKRVLHIDHDHQTGKFRGLICDRCNRGLGNFDDNKDAINRASLYLQKHSEIEDFII